MPLERWQAVPPKVLNPEIWRELRAVESLGNTGFIARLVELFLSDAAERLARLTRAVDEGDLPAVAREARALHRSAHHLGAMDMAGVAAAIESVGRDGQRRYADLLLIRLEQEFALVRSALTHS